VKPIYKMTPENGPAVRKGDLAAVPHIRTDGQVKGVVCPACFQSLEAAQMTRTHYTADAVPVRHYYGHCYHCRTSCEAVQFYRDNKWVLHQVRQFHIGDKESRLVTVVPMPAAETLQHGPAAPVIGKMEFHDGQPVLKFGPGGEYAEEITEQQIDSVLKGCTELFAKLGKLLEQCLDLKRQFKQSKKHD